MDENLKRQAEALFDEMGMNMTTAITIFAKTVVRQGRIPFEITVDPFWSEANQKRIRETIESYRPEEMIFTTMEELEAMAHE
jgi:DNA-damage-inducible protein J